MAHEHTTTTAETQQQKQQQQQQQQQQQHTICRTTAAAKKKTHSQAQHGMNACTVRWCPGREREQPLKTRMDSRPPLETGLALRAASAGAWWLWALGCGTCDVGVRAPAGGGCVPYRGGRAIRARARPSAAVAPRYGGRGGGGRGTRLVDGTPGPSARTMPRELTQARGPGTTDEPRRRE